MNQNLILILVLAALVFLLLFVILLALAYWCFHKKEDKDSSPIRTIESTKPTVLRPAPKEMTQVGPAVRVIYGDASSPLAEISLLESKIKKQVGAEVPVTPALKSQLELMLRDAPALLLSGKVASQATYLLKWSPDVTKAIANGEWRTMAVQTGGIRAIAVDANSQIAGHGELLRTSATQAAAATVAVWQVLAVITSQKYLADISKQLRRIESLAQEILQFLDGDRWANLRASIDYVRNWHESVSLPDITHFDLSALLAQLETIEREAMRFARASEDPQDGILQQYQSLVLTGIGWKRQAEEAHKLVDQFRQNAKEHLTALYLRGCASQVRASLPASRQVSLARAKAVAEGVSRQLDRQERFQTLVKKRIPEVKGEFSWDSTDMEFQSALRGHLEANMTPLMQLGQEVSSCTANLTRQLETDLSPSGDTRLVAKLNASGELVSLHRSK